MVRSELLLLCLLPFAASAAPKVIQNPNPAAPLAALVQFPAANYARAVIEVSDGKHRSRLSFDNSYNPEKGLPVVGLRPARPHTLRIQVFDSSNKRIENATLTHTTPALPTGDDFPPIQITKSNPKRMEPGYTLFSPRRASGVPAFGANFGMITAIDSAGEVVWYYRTNSRISDLERRPNGNILYVTQDFRVTEIDLLGNIVRQWYSSRRPQGPAKDAIPVDSLTFHHEVDVLPNGNLVVLGSEIRELGNYFTSETDPNSPRKRQRVMGDEVVEFDLAGNAVWKWRAFDHLDPFRIGYETFDGYWFRRGFPGVIDFSHANGVVHDPSDDSLLINFRIQSAVVKVDRKTKQIKWIAGEPEGWPASLQDKLFQMEGNARWFYHQHCPSMTPHGTLLLFDNGNYGSRPYNKTIPPHTAYSRAVEYRLDEKTRTLREVWTSETGGADAVLSTAMGDVQWLPKTGNVLAHYGSLWSPEERLARKDWSAIHASANWSRIREYTHTMPAKLLFEAVIGNPGQKEGVAWVIYGGDRIPELLPNR